MGRKGENIFHRKDSRWEARYVKGYSFHGKCIYGYLCGKSYQEVKNKRIQVLLDSNCTQYIQKKIKNNVVLFQDKIELWLKQQKLSVKLSTYTYYSCVVFKHIMPTLGDIPLSSINDSLIFSYIEEMIDRQKLKMTTIHEIIGILKQILSFCDIYIKIKLPKKEKHNIQTLSLEDRNILENYIHLHFDDIGIGILLSLYAGLRIGEVCALTWKDIDFSSGFLQINKTVSRVRNLDSLKKAKTKLVLSSAKTANSIRLIPLNKHFLTLLEQYKNTHQKDDTMFVLSSSNQFMDPRNYYNKYKNILRRCQLEQFNYHSLRHTFATSCIEGGLDAKSLSEILGHSDIKITLSLYVHPDIDRKRKFMNQDLLCPSFFSQNSSQN